MSRFSHVDPDTPTPTRLNRGALRRILGWLRPYRWVILINVCLSLILTGAELMVPLLLQWAIDGVIRAIRSITAAVGEVERAAVFAGAWHDLGLLIGGFVGLFFLMGVVRYFEIYRTMVYAQRFMYGMRRRFFSHLHCLSLRFYDKWKSGQLIARGTADMDALQETIAWAPSHILSSAFMLVGACAAMFWKDPVLFGAVFPILPVLYLLTRRFRIKASDAWRQVRAQTGRLTANVAESIAGARVIQAFAREQRNYEVFGNLTDRLYDTRIETERVHGRYMIGTRSIWMCAQVIVIIFGAWRITVTSSLPEGEGRVTAGTVAAFLVYVAMFFRPIDMLTHIYSQLLHSLAAADRVIEVLDTEPEIVDRPGAVSPTDFEGDVTFDHVTFSYIEGTPVLHDVSFRVRPGEVIALVGPTGAGKTTVCRLIARFYEAQQGYVCIDDRDIRDIAQSSLHKRMGIVLQENFLFAGTVMDNIRYGRPDATDEEVIQCARQIGSHAAIEALPQGFETEVGERGGLLSAGQRQLICFTRAMLAGPRILILDEATSSVDTQTELKVQEALRRLTQRRTCFIVAHRLSTVRSADRVLVIEDGRLTEEGAHQDLLAAGGRYAMMYEEFIRSE
ncbi:MAG: ABC transporter ATP-binding protein [Planctomycetota bacterium]|nr:ABC transporter ATP-binding protein [Planctomycetota bacterium]